MLTIGVLQGTSQPSTDASTDAYLRPVGKLLIQGYLYAGPLDNPLSYDGYLRRLRYISDDIVIIAPAPPPATGAQGLRVRKGSGTLELQLVVVADATPGMGGQWRFRRADGITYVVQLVETTDPNASPLRLKTATGVKAARLI